MPSKNDSDIERHTDRFLFRLANKTDSDSRLVAIMSGSFMAGAGIIGSVFSLMLSSVPASIVFGSVLVAAIIMILFGIRDLRS